MKSLNDLHYVNYKHNKLDKKRLPVYHWTMEWLQ